MSSTTITNGETENYPLVLVKSPPSADWFKCPIQSNGAIANLFIAFKTPLSSKLQYELDPDYRFSPAMFLNSFKIQSAKIGLWIDSTSVNNFYKIQEVQKEGTRYEKLFYGDENAESISLHAPSEEIVTLFNKLCNQFLKSRTSTKEFIGVHCTLGFNLCGFLICSFLIDYLQFTIKDAFAEFANKRPNGIYNPNLLNRLFEKYGEDGPHNQNKQMQILQPKWKEVGDRNKNQNQKAKFVLKIQGVQTVCDKEKLVELQRKVQRICGWSRGGFPGRTVVTLSSGNIDLLHERPYLISQKADGRRYMLFIQKEGDIYFVDRENCFYQILDDFEFPFSSEESGEHFIDTLIDGEIITDNNGQHLFITNDIIAYNGDSVKSLIFNERFKYLKDVIDKKIAHVSKDRLELEPIQVVQTAFYQLWEVENVLELNTNYEADGLIFIPCGEPYNCGSCDLTVKWKSGDLSTVDFLFKIEETNTKKIGKLYVGGLDPPLGEIEINQNLTKLDGKIIECYYEESKWKLFRHRIERISPNSYNTAMEVIASILEPVTKDVLFHTIRGLVVPGSNGHCNENGSHNIPQ